MRGGKVSEVAPTAEEQSVADRLFAEASKLKKHSISNAMHHFNRNNPDTVTSLAEGALKERCIKKNHGASNAPQEISEEYAVVARV